MGPSVEWISDGFRFKSDQDERLKLHKKLYYMYRNRGFKNIIEINDLEYSIRLDKTIKIADRLLTDKNYMSRY